MRDTPNSTVVDIHLCEFELFKQALNLSNKRNSSLTVFLEKQGFVVQWTKFETEPSLFELYLSRLRHFSNDGFFYFHGNSSFFKVFKLYCSKHLGLDILELLKILEIKVIEN